MRRIRTERDHGFHFPPERDDASGSGMIREGSGRSRTLEGGRPDSPAGPAGGENGTGVLPWRKHTAARRRRKRHTSPIDDEPPADLIQAAKGRLRD